MANPVQMLAPLFDKIMKFFETELHDLNNVDYKNFNRIDVAQLFINSDLHFTMSSTATIEAASLGCVSFTFCPTLLPGNHYENMFRELRGKGLVIQCDLECEAIKKKLDEHLSYMRDDDSNFKFLIKKTFPTAANFMKSLIEKTKSPLNVKAR